VRFSCRGSLVELWTDRPLILNAVNYAGNDSGETRWAWKGKPKKAGEIVRDRGPDSIRRMSACSSFCPASSKWSRRGKLAERHGEKKGKKRGGLGGGGEKRNAANRCL